MNTASDWRNPQIAFGGDEGVKVRFRKAFIPAMVATALLTGSAHAEVLIQDNFSYSPALTTLDGASPSSTGGVGSSNWTATGAAIATSGSGAVLAGVTSSGDTDANANYSVTLAANTVYTLTAVLNYPSVMTDGDYYTRLGFYPPSRDWNIHMLVRPQSATGFANGWGPANNTFADGIVGSVGGDGADAYNSPLTLKVVYDTGASTVQYFINDIAGDLYTLTDSYTDFTSIGFGFHTTDYEGTLGYLQSIALTSNVPEPSAMALLGIGMILVARTGRNRRQADA